MDVCGLAVHQVTYRDIWVRREIIILDAILDSCHDCYDYRYDSCYDHFVTLLYALGLRWYEIKVYRWGFPCLDYSFDVLVSWDRDLSVYNQSCLWSALYRISCFMIIMLYLFIPVLTHLPPEYFLLGIIRTLVLVLASPLGFSIPLAWGVSLTPLDLTSRSWS